MLHPHGYPVTPRALEGQPRMDPVELEASGQKTVNVEYNGATYALPASMDDCDGDVIDNIDREKLGLALEAIMGPDEWRRFKATKPKVRDYGEMFSTYAKAIGLESAGE